MRLLLYNIKPFEIMLITIVLISSVFIIISGCSSGGGGTSTGFLTGKIIIPEETNFSGILVYLVEVTSNRTTAAAVLDLASTTNVAGEYRINSIPEGVYTLVAVKENYQTINEPNIYVKANSENKMKDIVMSGSGTMNGTVTLSDSTEFSNILVFVKNYPNLSTLTDIRGGYQITGIPIGKHSITAQKSGYTSNVQENVDIKTNVITTIDMTLSPDLTFTPLEPPKNIRISVGASLVNIEWDNYVDDNLLGFHVYRSTAFNGIYSKINENLITPTSTSFQDDTVDQEVTYYYYVVPVDINNTSGEKTTVISAKPHEFEAKHTLLYINSGKDTTSTPNVNLTLTAVHATEMMISNDSRFVFSDWEPYNTQKSWIINPGDGQRYVYVKFRDIYGNITTPIFDTIELYTNPPVIIEKSADASNTSVVINWKTDKNGTSIVEYWNASDVLMASVNTKSNSNQNNVTNHSVQITSLTENTLYNYRVQTVDMYGRIGYSEIDSFKTVKIVNSDINADTTWTGDVLVTENIKIFNNSTLTIAANSHIKFETDVYLTVEDGSLDVNTDPSVPNREGKLVKFSSNSKNPKAGEWGGIIVGENSNNVNIQYSIIREATIGLSMHSATGAVSRTIISHNTTGISIDWAASPSITKCTIQNNAYGIVCKNYSNFTAFSSNNIMNNIEYNFMSGIHSGTIVVENAWWGTTSTTDINNMIFDYKDNAGYGEVDYDPMSTASFNIFAP